MDFGLSLAKLTNYIIVITFSLSIDKSPNKMIMSCDRCSYYAGSILTNNYFMTVGISLFQQLGANCYV